MVTSFMEGRMCFFSVKGALCYAHARVCCFRTRKHPGVLLRIIFFVGSGTRRNRLIALQESCNLIEKEMKKEILIIVEKVDAAAR